MRSKTLHYRVIVNLTQNPLEIIRLNNVALKEGTYQVLFKGESQKTTEALAEIILGFVGYKVENSALPLDHQPSFTLSHIFRVEKKRRIDFRFKVSGQGTLILDTVRIVPVNKIP